MPTWRVCGESPLEGCVKVQGAKNAVLPIMAASLLHRGETTLENCPDLLDVKASVEILRHLGCSVEQSEGVIHIDSSAAAGTHIPHALMLKMRSSVMFLGAILARSGEVRLSTPGGCELGSRPIDLHLRALREMGAELDESCGEVHVRAAQLRGAHINLDFPSVGATENIMLAACAAEGRTVITNAAREPEIEELQRYLRSAGAKITGAGTPVVTVEGFEGRRGELLHRVMPDRIAAATFLCAAAAAGGEICVKAMCPEHIQTVLSSLEGMGCDIISSADSVRLVRRAALRAARPVITRPYPGFPTDAQALMMAACLKAEGNSVFVENIFENRYRHAVEMRRLGADIRLEGRVAVISGTAQLCGAPVTATDLRGGASLIIAGLSAQGQTLVYDSGHIERGYEGLDIALRSVGADITKEQ